MTGLAAAFTGLCVLYLLWFGWYVFIQNKGNPGGLGLALAAGAFIQIMSSMKDLV